MRLICPTCETAYEVPTEQIPAGGRQVQCSNCHTNWRALPVAEPAPSEDQIIYRLEARSARPRPVAPAQAPAPPPAEPSAARPADGRDGFVWETAAPPRPSPLGPLRTQVAEAPRPPPPEPAREVLPPVDEPAVPPTVPEQAAPPPPTLRPSPLPPTPAEPERPREVVQQVPPPAPVPVRAPRPEPERGELPPPTPARPAEVPQPRALPGIPGDAVRIDGRAQPPRDEPDAERVEARVVEPPPQSRFGRGLVVAFALFAAALAVYLYGRELAAGVPALAPAVEAYAGAVDRLREAMVTEFHGR